LREDYQSSREVKGVMERESWVSFQADNPVVHKVKMDCPAHPTDKG